MLYLLSGSYRLINEEKEKIIGNSKEVSVFDGLFAPIKEIITEANYVSFFDTEKILIIKNADFFASETINTEDTNALLAYFAHPNAQCKCIFMTEKKLDKRKKITKEILQVGHVVEIEPLYGNRLVEKVQDLLRKKGYTIETQALDYMIKNCQNNYDLIYNEIEKLELYYVKPTKILYQDVKKVCARVLEENNFKFVDAVISKDMEKAFTLLQDLYIQKVDPIALYGLLSREYRLLLDFKIYEEQRVARKEIAEKLKLQSWQIDKLFKESLSYEIAELKENVVLLGQLDVQIKSGQIDRFLGFNAFLLQVMDK